MIVRCESTVHLVVEFPDNGDFLNFKKVIADWNFKDEQSLIRFVLSIMIESEDKSRIGILKEGEITEFSPADSLLKA